MSKDKVFKFPLDSVPLEGYCEMSRETPEAIRTRICRGEWAEGQEYQRAPNGRIWIILEGVNRWAASARTAGQKASNHDVAA